MHGVKRLFGWMIPRFDETRFNVSLLSLRKRDLSEETLEQQGIRVYYLSKTRFDPTTLTALTRLLRQLSIDVIQTHGYGATTFGRAAAFLLRMPNVLHEHANLTDTRWFQKIPDTLFNPVTDVAIAVSESTRRFCIEGRCLSPERVKLCYLGAPLEEFRRRSPAEEQAARAAFSFTDREEQVVGTVTRLHESKGNRYFVEAAAIVARERPRTRFVIVGEGPLRAELETQAERQGLAGKLHFLGFQKDVASAFAAFHVVCFPSLWEGTPLTVFEAMAMGKTIVSTDADGLRDVLTPEHNAVMVPARDADALARGLLRVLDDPALAQRLGVWAQSASRAYDIQLFVDKMSRLYELLVSRYREVRFGRPRWDYERDFEFLEATVLPAESTTQEARA